MSEFSSIRDLIAQLDKEDELWEKETQNHFENQRNKYKEIFEKVKDVKGKRLLLYLFVDLHLQSYSIEIQQIKA